MRARVRVYSTPILLVAGAAVALGSGPALAAKLGNCTTITAPGFYELTRNLSPGKNTADCLIVAADFVTIDLHGFAIIGSGDTGRGISDRGVPRRSVAIRNGAITGFEVCVFIEGGSAIVEQVVATDCDQTGIGVGSASLIIGSVANDGGNVGMQAGDGSIVRDNIVTFADFGMVVGATSVVSGNNVTGSDDGLTVGVGSTVTGNTTVHAEGGEDGLNVTCPSNVSGNTVTGALALVRGSAACINFNNAVGPSQ